MGNLIGFASLTTDVISNKRVLRLALTTAGVVGTRTFCIGKRNIAVADNGLYGHLCVFNDTSAPAVPNTSNINGVRYTCATSGKAFCIVGSPQGDITPTNSIVLGNVAVAVNAAGDMIVKDCTSAIGTPDEEDVVFLGETPLRVVRKGKDWYWVVKS